MGYLDRGGGFLFLLSDRQNGKAGDQAKCSASEEGWQVTEQGHSRPASSESRDGCTNLMSGENPAKHKSGAFCTEAGGGESYCRRNRRDPIKTVKNSEQ
jgi:hypothetical protein